uniref:Uncharacterized protein n=1 Tax=Auxenochlorella protothecoides TaxID=3075 RepID=A0A1D2A8F6_AUXPR
MRKAKQARGSGTSIPERNHCRADGDVPGDARTRAFQNGLGLPEAAASPASMSRAAHLMDVADRRSPVADLVGLNWPMLPIATHQGLVLHAVQPSTTSPLLTAQVNAGGAGSKRAACAEP